MGNITLTMNDFIKSLTKYLFDISDWGVAGEPIVFSTKEMKQYVSNIGATDT